MSAPEQLPLPLTSWTEDATLKKKDGGHLSRWGSVEQACKILDDCDRQTIYDLIGSRDIKGYKRKPKSKNSHWRVDLLSVWLHKQGQMSPSK